MYTIMSRVLNTEDNSIGKILGSLLHKQEEYSVTQHSFLERISASLELIAGHIGQLVNPEQETEAASIVDSDAEEAGTEEAGTEEAGTEEAGTEEAGTEDRSGEDTEDDRSGEEDEKPYSPKTE